MEHNCMKCDWLSMGNQIWKKCPECGGEVYSVFDEQFDHYPDAEGGYYDDENEETYE